MKRTLNVLKATLIAIIVVAFIVFVCYLYVTTAWLWANHLGWRIAIENMAGVMLIGVPIVVYGLYLLFKGIFQHKV